MLSIILQQTLVLIATTSVMSLQAGHYVFIDEATGKKTVIEKKLARPDQSEQETLTTTSITGENVVQLGNHAGQFDLYKGLEIRINNRHTAGQLQFDEVINIPPRMAATYDSSPMDLGLPIYQRLACLSRSHTNPFPCVVNELKDRNILLPSGPFATDSIATTGVLRLTGVTRDSDAVNQFNMVGYLPFYRLNQPHEINVRVNVTMALDEEDRTTGFIMRRAEDDYDQQNIGNFQLTLNGVDEITMTSAETRRIIGGSLSIPPLSAHVAGNSESELPRAESQNDTLTRFAARVGMLGAIQSEPPRAESQNDTLTRFAARAGMLGALQSEPPRAEPQNDTLVRFAAARVGMLGAIQSKLPR